MERIKFNDYAEVGDFLYENASQNKIASVVLFFKDAVKLLQWVLQYDDIKIGSIDLEDFDISEYDKEYYFDIDEEKTLYIEKVYNEDNIIKTHYADIALYSGDSSSKIAIKDICDDKYELVMPEDEEETIETDTEQDIDKKYLVYEMSIDDFIELLSSIF